MMWLTATGEGFDFWGLLTEDQAQNLVFWGITAFVTVGIDTIRRFLYRRIDKFIDEQEEEQRDDDE